MPLCLNEREIAVVGPGAGHQLSEKWRRARRELPQQRLFQQRLNAVLGNIDQDHILSCRTTDLAVAIGVAQIGQLRYLFRADPARGNAQTHRCQLWLLLRRKSQMIGVSGMPHVSARRFQFAPQTRRQFLPQTIDSPFLNEECQTAPGARLSRTVIAINPDQFSDCSGCLVSFDKNI